MAGRFPRDSPISRHDTFAARILRRTSLCSGAQEALLGEEAGEEGDYVSNVFN